ncbi:MAG: YeeE/YedE family protein, partial [Flavobacteriales bacterium]|nr:YeeE/YedE family protein [Flavobacteriales bacterium]
DVDGQPWNPMVHDKGWIRYLTGGTLFGLGWAMTGACPGPLFINAGAGYTVFFVAIGAALFGTIVYALVKNRLPQ